MRPGFSTSERSRLSKRRISARGKAPRAPARAPRGQGDPSRHGRRHIYHAHPQEPARDEPAIDYLLHQGLRQVDGDGEAYVLGLPDDRRVDPYNLTLQVHQGAAAVAGIDAGICLDGIDDRVRAFLYDASFSAHDASGHRGAARQVQGVADGYDVLPDLKLAHVPQLRRGEIRRVDPEDGQVSGRIRPHYLGTEGPVITERDDDAAGQGAVQA